MNYHITKEIRIHHEDGWFYQFTDDNEYNVELSCYEVNGIEETKQGSSFSIPKDCISQFINVLEQMRND